MAHRTHYRKLRLNQAGIRDRISEFCGNQSLIQLCTDFPDIPIWIEEFLILSYNLFVVSQRTTRFGNEKSSNVLFPYKRGKRWKDLCANWKTGLMLPSLHFHNC